MLKKWLVGIVGATVIGLGGMSAVQADHPVGTINCDNFSSGEEVYEFWTSHGYSADNDPEGLDRDSDGLPCESLTSGIAGQFQSYEANLNDNDEDSSDDGAVEEEATEEAAESEESTEEGDALPVTATSYPTMMLFGLATAGFGAAGFFLYRRRTATV